MNNLELDAFLDDLSDSVPGVGRLHQETAIASLSVIQKLTVLRRIQLLVAKPVELDILGRYNTIHDLWLWMLDTLEGDSVANPSLFVSATSTGRVRLRPVREDDLMPLYAAAMDPERSIMWRFRGTTIPPDRFVSTLYDGVRCQYAVEDQDSGSLIGLVVAYDHHDVGGHCKIGLYRVDGARVPNGWGMMTEGLACLINHLFLSFPYRKVYAEVPSYNMELVRGFCDEYMTEEACLQDYTFGRGSYADQHVLSISRQQWTSFLEKWDGGGVVGPQADFVGR